MEIEKYKGRFVAKSCGLWMHFPTREMAEKYVRKTKNFDTYENKSACMEIASEIYPAHFKVGMPVFVNMLHSDFTMGVITDVFFNYDGWSYEICEDGYPIPEEQLCRMYGDMPFSEYYSDWRFEDFVKKTKVKFVNESSRVELPDVAELVHSSKYLCGIQAAMQTLQIPESRLSGLIEYGFLKASERMSEKILGKKYKACPTKKSKFAQVTYLHEYLRNKTGAVVYDDYGLCLWKDNQAFSLINNVAGKTLYELGGSI